jgi:multidrug efflux system outer membrane protein
MDQRAIQAAGNAVVLRAQMNRLTGAPVDRAFTAVEPAVPSSNELPPIPELLAEAAKERPEIQRAAVAERIAENDRRAAKSPLVPQVAAQAAFDVSGTRFTDRASAWIVGGEFRWSLSTGGGERAQMKAATAGAARARAEAEDVRSQVHVEVVSAVEQMRSARARHAVGQAAVAQARESERIIRDRYQAGLLPINDVLRAATGSLARRG